MSAICWFIFFLNFFIWVYVRNGIAQISVVAHVAVLLSSKILCLLKFVNGKVNIIVCLFLANELFIEYGALQAIYFSYSLVIQS